MAKIRTRFAPSPTGALHIGGLRTALYAYAMAKHSSGDFILRIEDTDKKREVPGSKEKIKELLTLEGLKWDEYYEQSKRVEEGIYKKAAEKLVAEEHAFYCQHKGRNAKEEGYSKELRDSCRDLGLKEGAIKLKVSDGEKISFTDFVLGKEVSWDTSTVADTTLLKSDGFPTYHLAVVVDDTDMNVTHVLRGHDWMPSTPVHLLVYKYLGYKVPEIGHLTDILDPEGGKLSKRKGSTSLDGLLSEGYLPEAILNFVMLLGWAPKDNREQFSLAEFVKTFDPSGFQKSNPIFNKEKLDWFSGEYIRRTQNSNLKSQIWEFLGKKYPAELIEQTIPLVKERMKKLSDYWSMAGFFFEEKRPDMALFGSDYKKHLTSAHEALLRIDTWNKASIDDALMNEVKDNLFNTGDFFMDLRVAITGGKFTPPINDSIVILGKEETLSRIKKII
ncbi:glutamate--tRNA ligase [Patescibacteria group bacterium]|nr:glutamate--tRNA ligase [Patescibacteria group bacterium]